MEIKINSEEYSQAKSSLTEAESETLTALDSVPEETSVTNVLEAYEEQLRGVYERLQSCKEFVERDVVSLGEVHESYMEWDTSTGEKFRPQE